MQQSSLPAEEGQSTGGRSRVQLIHSEAAATSMNVWMSLGKRDILSQQLIRNHICQVSLLADFPDASGVDLNDGTGHGAYRNLDGCYVDNVKFLSKNGLAVTAPDSSSLVQFTVNQDLYC
jgi:hypothetical protein